MEINWKYWKNGNLYIFNKIHILPHLKTFETFHDIIQKNIYNFSCLVDRILPINFHGSCQK